MSIYSILHFIPSYKVLFKDANLILFLFATIMIIGNLFLISITENRWIAIIVGMSIFIGILSMLIHVKKLLPLLKDKDNIAYYMFAAIEYFMLMIGFLPIYLYLYVNLQWQWLNEDMIETLSQFNQYIYWMFPIYVFLLISCAYWIIMYHLKKENTLLYILEKVKSDNL